MEGKASVGSSSPSASNSTKITSGKESGKKSSSGLFKSVFPPDSTVMGMDSSRGDIFAPSRKQESAGGSNIGHNFIMKDTSSIYQNEKTDPCHLSSSLYYGAQDVYSSHPSTSYVYKSADNYKKDVTNNSSSSRGDWWEDALLPTVIILKTSVE